MIFPLVISNTTARINPPITYDPILAISPDPICMIPKNNAEVIIDNHLDETVVKIACLAISSSSKGPIIIVSTIKTKI
ncbi:Uncharacterised protein [Mycoplasma putrefaciens]|nr:Uncharacterised protein [Mycoplasma putrefaciens]